MMMEVFGYEGCIWRDQGVGIGVLRSRDGRCTILFDMDDWTDGRCLEWHLNS